MAINEMDARLISQAEQVTSVEGTALVPISTESGQPQKNISLADMAGSMGAQANEVADIKTLWGQTSDGQMVQINKASIASVLGNLLYGADTKEELASVVAGLVYDVNSPVFSASSIAVGQEVDTGISQRGLYLLASNSSGYLGLLFIAYTTAGDYVITNSNGDGFSNKEGVSNTLRVYRKSRDSNVYVLNNYSSGSSRQIYIRRLAKF